MNTKKFNKLNNAEKLRILLGMMQDYAEGYFGDSFDIDQAMAVDISYLRGVVSAIHTSNMQSLGLHKHIAEQSIALMQKPFSKEQHNINPFS